MRETRAVLKDTLKEEFMRIREGGVVARRIALLICAVAVVLMLSVTAAGALDFSDMSPGVEANVGAGLATISVKAGTKAADFRNITMCSIALQNDDGPVALGALDAGSFASGVLAADATLVPGVYTATARAADARGLTWSYVWTFSVEGGGEEAEFALGDLYPANGSTITDAAPEIGVWIKAGVVTDAVVTVDGVVLPEVIDVDKVFANGILLSTGRVHNVTISVSGPNGNASVSGAFTVAANPAAEVPGSVTCLDCHVASSHSFSNCDGCHGAGSLLGGGYDESLSPHGKGVGCSGGGCHDNLGPGDGSELDAYCAVCHSADYAGAIGAANVKHDWNEVFGVQHNAGNACAGAGCHGVAMTAIHSDCSTCHAGSVPPSGKACVNCHADNHYSFAGSTSSKGECARCHPSQFANVAVTHLGFGPAVVGLLAEDDAHACVVCHDKPATEPEHEVGPSSACYDCHVADNDWDAPDIQTPGSYSAVSTSKHVEKDPELHDPLETNNLALLKTNRHITCNDCHSVHESTNDNPFAGAIGVVWPGPAPEFTSGTTVGGWSQETTGDAWWQPNGGPVQLPQSSNLVKKVMDGTPTADYAEGEWMVCFKCHAGQGANLSGLNQQIGMNGATTGTFPGAYTATDLSREFNPNNPSGHRVVAQPDGTVKFGMQAAYTANPDEGITLYNEQGVPSASNWPLPALTGNYRFLRENTDVPGVLDLSTGRTANDLPITGLSWDSLLKCTDCHSGSSTDAAMGPHGGQARYMLDDGWTGRDWRYVSVATMFNTTGANSYICAKCHFMGNALTNGTAYIHVNYVYRNDSSSSKRNMTCVQCHTAIPHGWKRPRLLVNVQDLNTPYLDPRGTAVTGNATNVILSNMPANASRASNTTQWTSNNATAYGCNGTCNSHGAQIFTNYIP